MKLLAICIGNCLLASLSFGQGGQPLFEDQNFAAPVPMPFAEYGYNVVMDGNWAGVAFAGDPTLGFSNGSIVMHRRTPTGFEIKQRVFAPDVVWNLNFPQNLDMKGDLLVATATNYPKPQVYHTGITYTYEFDGTQWNHQDTIPYPDSVHIGFGVDCVVVDNETLLVSAPTAQVADPQGNHRLDNGLVHVFRRMQGAWKHVQEIQFSEPLSAAPHPFYNWTGHDLDAAGDRVIVSVTQGIPPHYAHVLVRDNLGFWSHEDHLIMPEFQWDSEFGEAVAISENYAAIGAPRDTTVAAPGYVYIYERTTAGWNFMQRIQASDGAVTVGTGGSEGDKFGAKLDFDGTRLVVGARTARRHPGGCTQGAAYVFELQNGQWVETFKLWELATELNPCPWGLPGGAVAISGDTAWSVDSFATVTGMPWAGASLVYHLPFGDTTCDGVVNSTGSMATIEALGSREAVEGHLTLRMGSLPSGNAGFLLGSQAPGLIRNPGGSLGNLCLSGNLARFNQQIAFPDADGVAEVHVDMTQIPHTPVAAIQAGQTWHFQYWYRDSVGGPTSNFSSAVGVTFR